VKLVNLNISLIKMVILEENFKWHLEAFASELFIYEKIIALCRACIFNVLYCLI